MARIDTRLPMGFLFVLSFALLILSSTFATPISTESTGDPSSSVIEGNSSNSSSKFNGGGNPVSSTLPGSKDMTSVSKSNQALDTTPSESENISEVSGPPSPSLEKSAVNSDSLQSGVADETIPSLTKVVKACYFHLEIRTVDSF